MTEQDKQQFVTILVQALQKHPIPVYLVDAPFLFHPEQFDDRHGFWEPQRAFAVRAGISVNTLRRYRERRYAVSLSTSPVIIRDKTGNILKPVSDKPNASYLYFVRHASNGR